MSILQSIRHQLVPVHPDGYKFIAAFAIVTLVLAWAWTPLGWIGAILTAWCIYFFRDPARLTPQDPTLVVSPADGRISAVGWYVPPPELGLGTERLQRISVFMSVFDCHVNRAPVAGKIIKIVYKAGRFLNAELDKASEHNERNSLVLQNAAGKVGVVQIAGLVARRILCFAKPGDILPAGERFGLIRFGSRLDVYLPQGSRALVGIGAKAIAGETILADFHADQPARPFRLT